MDKRFFFERNLLALSGKDPALCSRLSTAETTLGRYKFLESRSGESVPAWVDPSGAAHPLHSLVDPEKEGKRLIDALGDEGFLIFLGLGGGYPIQAALEREGTHRVLAIDYDINGIAELLASRDYIALFNDPRFSLLIDAPASVLEKYILEQYQPVLHRGIRSFPLRARTEFDQRRFIEAGEAAKAAISRISSDYSVQAYFGKRWFSNIIRNLGLAETQGGPVPPIRHAAVTAAGPSLDMQLPVLAERRPSRFIIAVDTSLPSLLKAGLEPDAVISIDCQHISYHHFIGCLPRNIPLFLDLASPPVVASCSRRVHFFSGGHPLDQYISRYWRPFPAVDTSGGNVTCAALSLADSLGARNIELYGADFSYPLGQTYARGTYIYPYFGKQQNRFNPLEALFSAFLYRSPSLTRISRGDSWYYETAVLRAYRERLEEKSRSIGAEVVPVPGLGAPLAAGGGGKAGFPHTVRLFSPGRASMGAKDFLARYRGDIKNLPPVKTGISAYLGGLNPGETLILATLLPSAAAIQHRHPEFGAGELFESLRTGCLGEIDLVLAAL
jgi:hypothetical protein